MLTKDEQRYIQENLNADVSKILLSPPPKFKNNIKFLVDQILSRRKAKDKLPSWYANHELVLPPPLSIEQSSSELLADYKSKLVSGKLLIDLTGGMDVDCMAMSNSFDEAIYTESDPHLCRCFELNSKTLGRSIKIINKRSEEFLADKVFPTKPVIFIDPDRRSDSKKMVGFSDCSPDVSSMIDFLKDKATHLLVKASPLLDIKAGIKDLGGVSEVHVLSVKNECKEVLFLKVFLKEDNDPIIKCINYITEGTETFDFRFSEENGAESEISNASNFLLLPNASVLKAGAFKTIGGRFGLSKIAVNTHIYTSELPVPNFPGRQFKVISDKMTSGEIKEYLPQGRVNVITRNYPAKPEKVLKKLKLKEGGELYLIGFRDQHDKGQLVVAQRSR